MVLNIKYEIWFDCFFVPRGTVSLNTILVNICPMKSYVHFPGSKIPLISGGENKNTPFDVIWMKKDIHLECSYQQKRIYLK